MDANLLKALADETKLDNMIIYGNVRCAINKPKFIPDSVALKDGFFALIDVLALKCNGVDYFGKDSNNIYFSRGSIVIILQDKSMVGTNIKVYGRTNKGCTIKKQKCAGDRDGIVAFVWAKDRDGSWCLMPNKALPFGVSDAKGTVLEDRIVSIVNGIPIKFEHPNTVNAIAEYYGDKNASPIELQSIKGGLDYIDEPIDVSKIKMNLTYRLSAKEKHSAEGVISDDLTKLRNLSKNFTLDLVKNIESEAKSDDETTNIARKLVDSFVFNIADRYNLSLGGTKFKCKEIIDKFLDDIQGINYVDESSDEKPDSKKVFKDIENIKKNIPLSSSGISRAETCIPVLKNTTLYGGLVIGAITGIGVDTIYNNYKNCHSYNNLSVNEWFWCLIRNPYYCGMLGGLKVWDCDRILLAFSNNINVDDCNKYRDMLMTLDKIKNSSSRDTLIPIRNLLSTSYSYSSVGEKYINDNNTIYSQGNLEAVVIVTGVNREDLLVDKSFLSPDSEVEDILDNLNNLGLIEIVDDCIILTEDLYKEHKIYSTLITKGKEETGITLDNVNETIREFEKSRGFSLESLQRDGIQLSMHKAGVLSGCAGSGKTTTSDCIVEVLQNYLPDYKLKFGAPTGKAARRLAEVVGGNVKTIHSMFGLGLGSEPYLKSKDRFVRKSDEGSSYAYILDEMAMCDTNLMYEIISHINDDDIIYFLGDIKQLPPIGKGNPFRSLMHFLPCVELGVSKRASENGKINYNCALINFVSDGTVVELQEGDDFKVKPCIDADIPQNTVNIFKDLLEEFDEDDIQVISGYQTDKYSWSTSNLNPLLQKVIRKPTELLFMYNNNKYMMNDRVIHVKRNSYEMPRYRVRGNSTFEEVVTFGIVNGELGKIIGVIPSVNCNIIHWECNYSEEELNNLPEEMKDLIDKRVNTSVAIREDISGEDESLYYVVVQTYDVDLKENVVVLYHATFKQDINSDFSTTFVGGDLKYLELAYALTTHKMQGSQSKAVIIPLGSKGSSSFMNRNMINTMITRASKKVVMLGSVRGMNSALTNGRRVTTINDGEDVLGILSE